MLIKTNCLHFRGDIPCKPHKDFGIHCEECEHYREIQGKILIIKLGAIGDVIRTTPLLHRITKEFPNHEIWWLTHYPEVVPSIVHKVLKFSFDSVIVLEQIKFDIAINLDKDYYATALMNKINAKKKFGFGFIDGRPAPINDLAQHKYLTGIFDDVNKANKLSYIQEIFQICGWEHQGEEYILEFDDKINFIINNEGKKIIGLNTGCGARWTSRLWSIDNWTELIFKLQDAGYHPLLLGGEAEHERNSELHNRTKAEYLGYFPLNQFIALLNNVDVLVTGVTMALHIGIGLKKKIVLFNNIFNPYEFDLYGRGVIIQPVKECKCFFKGKCDNPDYFCMDYLYPEIVFEEIQKLIHLPN